MEDPEEANQQLSGPMAEEPKPDILSDEARKIKVPSWWKGPTTMTDAQSVIVTMEKARNPT